MERLNTFTQRDRTEGVLYNALPVRAYSPSHLDLAHEPVGVEWVVYYSDFQTLQDWGGGDILKCSGPTSAALKAQGKGSPTAVGGCF